jgi:uncharacterized membrane protein SpoIIM required for sporulation
MNVERWLRARKPSWQRLEELLRLVDQKGLPSVDRQELQELGRLYRAASADLSRARAMKLGQDVQVYLNNLVVKAHNQVYQTQRNRWIDLLNFLWFGFPQLVRQHIIYVAISIALFMIPTFVSYGFVQEDIHFAQLETIKGNPLVSDEMWSMIEQHQMWTDAAEHYSALAAGLIFTNNMKVAILAFAFGITFGLGTVFVLISNGLSIGTIFGVCHTYGMAHRLLAFTAPHGAFELTAIFISGAGGLLLGKALLFPGRHSRFDALKLVAKQAGGLFAGCMPLLLVAGMIEGFISPRTDIPADTKFAISLATIACLILYLFVPRKIGATSDGAIPAATSDAK